MFAPEPAAAEVVATLYGTLVAKLAAARELEARLRDGAGVRLQDLVDVLGVPPDAELSGRLERAGFRRVPEHVELWEHPLGLFPLIETSGERRRAYVRVENVTDALEASGRRALEVEGEPGALVRRALVARDSGAELWLVERRIERRLVTSREVTASAPPSYARHLEALRLRPRPLDDAEAGFAAALELVRAARSELGDALACEAFFEAERSFYLRRNRAARIQKARQDALGIGLANHDHHTYRSSRAAFRSLVLLLESLGLACRERFYAGAEAGWGAQVMEHAGVGICVFADVDLSPDEVTGDFAHLGLEPREHRGTVGLWCELHGEAALAAGMHHLECQFDFEAARAGLAGEGIGTMPPFTNFPYLKQAFTEGEIWRVAAERLALARESGFIDDAQAARIEQGGALGSHLELLERNQGYKGFNQTGINSIIEATDPRRHG